MLKRILCLIMALVMLPSLAIATNVEDSIVIGMQAVKEDSIELEAAKAALAQGKNVAIVLLGAPYNAHLIPEGCAVVCCYSLTIEAVAAAIDVLKGLAQPTGKLPVKLSLA